MTSDLGDRCRNLLDELGLMSKGEAFEAFPLTGGVASDIAVVTVGDRKFCAKFALPKLKVEADWFAPVHRNAAEYAWLKVAAEIAPDSAVAMYGRSKAQHGFAMEFIEGDDIYLWKSALLDEAPDKCEAAKVGALLGRIHKSSALAEFDTSPFQNAGDFRALRIEPYLIHTSQIHTELTAQLGALADMLGQGSAVLVHGDVSPKNILFRAGNPVILDAECATMGDASFDLSFCLNHLILKAIHLPRTRDRNLQNVVQFWQAYSPHITWEDTTGLEARIARLLPALMLARVDGKSPVEYLNDKERENVRAIARPLIETPATSIDVVLNRISDALKETTS